MGVGGGTREGGDKACLREFGMGGCLACRITNGGLPIIDCFRVFNYVFIEHLGIVAIG